MRRRTESRAGEPGLEPRISRTQNLPSCQLDHPPRGVAAQDLRIRSTTGGGRRPPLYAHAVADAPTALIMAAGRGTRMRSALPKVLHPVCGRPMLHWVIGAAQEAGAARVVCVTRPGDGVAEALPAGVESVEQVEGEGTGAAVGAARERLNGAGTVLTLSGDHPLISAELIAELVASHARSGSAATMLTTDELDPTGYGRVVRAPDGSLERIVETKSTAGVDPARARAFARSTSAPTRSTPRPCSTRSRPSPRRPASATSPRSSRSSASAGTPSGSTRPRTRPSRWGSTIAPR